MNEQFWFGVIVGLVAFGFVILVLVTTRAGSVSQANLGLTVAGRANRDPDFAAKLQEMLGLPVPPSAVATGAKPSPAPPAKPTKPAGEALQILGILQQEARLIDFLMEDISQAPDQNLGQAVREIHRQAQKALQEHLVIEVVLSGQEGESVTVAKGFDPSAVRVLGNVTGEPPFQGELQHPGWKVKELKLPAISSSQNLYILQPAEVQVS